MNYYCAKCQEYFEHPFYCFHKYTPEAPALGEWNKMTKSPEVIEEWLDACIENSHKLSDWEKDFIDSVGDYFAIHRYISDKQEVVLERIYSDKTS